MLSGIYKITYRGKIYIGQSINLDKRMNEHLKKLKKSKHHNIHLQNVFNKYGVDDLKIETIEYCDKDLLDEREEYWIKYYNSYKNGYNQTSGGSGIGYNSKTYKYTKIKINGKYKKYRKVVNLSTGEIFDSVKEAVNRYNLKNTTQIHKVCRGESYTCNGYFWCYDYNDINIKEELELAEKRYNEYLQNNNQKVINITTAEIFKSANQAANYYNIPPSAVVNCINNKQHTAYGYVFMRYNDYLDYPLNEIIISNKDNSKKSKKVINVDTEEVYESMYQASIITGIPQNSISLCCRQKRQTAGGYQWEFYKDNNKYAKTKYKKQNIKKIINTSTNTVYDSASHASKELKLSVSSILRVCKGAQKTTGGYVFEFYYEIAN